MVSTITTVSHHAVAGIKITGHSKVTVVEITIVGAIIEISFKRHLRRQKIFIAKHSHGIFVLLLCYNKKNRT
jgi:hypothetical protein